MTNEMWTTRQVAKYLGIERDSVYMWLHRMGAKARPVARQPGNHGENLYDAEQIKSLAPQHGD